MFTGLVQHVGEIAEVSETPAGVRLEVDIRGWTPGYGVTIQQGDSISVSGTCLTVCETPAGGRLHFDVVQETLDKTTLGTLKPGGRVNLEPSVTPGQPMGGHFVQGHVDGVGEVVRVQDDAADWRVTVRAPQACVSALVPKGSITVEGVSLTLAVVDGDTFEVALIPTTLEHTTLGALNPGDRVNLEADVLAKTVVTTLKQMGIAPDGSTHRPSLSVGMLRDAGFLVHDAAE